MIEVNWPAPKNIKAFFTTAEGGKSENSYQGLNLASHIGDDIEAVNKNRAILFNQFPDINFFWLTQIHSTKIIKFPENKAENISADGIYTDKPKQACSVLTADCLPILLCCRFGKQVMALHAGWRGLLDGILPLGIKLFDANPKDLLVWFGPCIRGDVYEVDTEFKEKFVNSNSSYINAFIPSKNPGHWLFDLIYVAQKQCKQLGVNNIFDSKICTYKDNRFYSYRRNQKTGRFASFIFKI